MRYLLIVLAVALQTPQAPPAAKSAWLDAQNQAAAETLLTKDTLVVLPLGAGLREHGRHLPLGTDYYLAERLARDVMNATAIVVAPSLTYVDTASEQVVETVRTLARFGPRRFYVLNTGEVRPLRTAAATLANDGILLRYSNLTPFFGQHGKEPETSALLHVDATSVDMQKAGNDVATATAGRGKTVLETITATVVSEIDAMRKVALPTPRPPVPPRPRTARLPNIVESYAVSGCPQGEERYIREMADWFTLHWATKDADRLVELWAPEGDLVHPDGATEHGKETILRNRVEQFMRKEYSSSKLNLRLGVVRCISDDVAVVDGKWEITSVFDATGNALPPGDGLATLVLKKQPGWKIEAYRYTVNQQAVRPPTLLKKPWYPDK